SLLDLLDRQHLAKSRHHFAESPGRAPLGSHPHPVTVGLPQCEVTVREIGQGVGKSETALGLTLSVRPMAVGAGIKIDLPAGLRHVWILSLEPG
ncbi:MAG: hypothetical protein OEW23_18250, partial [Candidatus Aminicenantes bacterium]|nr:hypothetical protein [Candidatus Aminicenantes bacterium]